MAGGGGWRERVANSVMLWTWWVGMGVASGGRAGSYAKPPSAGQCALTRPDRDRAGPLRVHRKKPRVESRQGAGRAGGTGSQVRSFSRQPSLACTQAFVTWALGV